MLRFASFASSSVRAPAAARSLRGGWASRLGTLAVAAAVLGCLGCNQGRSSARIATVERSVGNVVTTWSFRYEDDGRLDEFTVTTGDDVDTYDYDYDDSGAVTEIAVSDESGATVVHEFEYEDGRLVEKDESGGGGTASTQIEYDDAGRPIHADELVEIGSDSRIERDVDLEYDDQGRLSQWLDDSTSTIEIIIIGNVTTHTATERELEYDDDTGVLETIRERVQVNDGDPNIDEVEYEYEDDRLVEVLTTANVRGDLDYDDEGRIESIDFTDTDDRYDFEYEEGSTSGLALEPFGLPYSMFFDLSGKPFPQIEFTVSTVLLGL